MVRLELLKEAPTVPATQIQAAFQSIRASLNAVVNGLQSNSPLGGMTSDREPLQNVFTVFKMIDTMVQSGNLKYVSYFLIQIQHLLGGLGE